MAAPLIVRVGAETSEFNQGMASLEKTVKKVGENLKDQFKDIGKGVVAAFAIEKVGEFFATAIEGATKLKEMSESTGLSTGFLQQLRLNARETGIDLEKVSKTFEHFNQELQSGDPSKSFTEGISALGLSITQLRSESPDEVYRDIAKAIAGVEDPAKRGALAMDLMGKGAAGLIPLLNKLTDNADKPLINLTNSDIQNIERVKNLWDRIGDSIESATGKVVGFLGKFTKSSVENVHDYMTDKMMAANPNLSADQASSYLSQYDTEKNRRLDEAGYNRSRRPGSQIAKKNKDIEASVNASMGDENQWAAAQLAKDKTAKEDAARDQQQDDALEKQSKHAEELRQKYADIADMKDKAGFEDMSDKDKMGWLDNKIQGEKDTQNFAKGPLNSDAMVESAKKQAEYELQRAELIKKTQTELKSNQKELASKQEEIDKVAAERQMETQKKAISATEEGIRRLEEGIKKHVDVDSLRAHGGGLRGVNYGTGTKASDVSALNKAQDQLKQQEMELLREQAAEQKKQTDILNEQLRYLQSLINNNPAFAA